VSDAIPRLVEIYEIEPGKSPFHDWLKSIRGSQVHGKILARLRNVARGNFGDSHYLGDGVSELRFMTKSGPRVYYGEDRITNEDTGEEQLRVMVLCGGLKGSQQRDIDMAKRFWRDHNAEAGS